ELGVALSTPAPRVPPIDLTGLQLTLWSRMVTEPQHVDALVASAHTKPAEVLGALTELELRGLVRQGPGMVFGLTRVRSPPGIPPGSAETRCDGTPSIRNLCAYHVAHAPPREVHSEIRRIRYCRCDPCS